jgi:hypothetical protein
VSNGGVPILLFKRKAAFLASCGHNRKDSGKGGGDGSFRSVELVFVCLFELLRSGLLWDVGPKDWLWE